METDYDTWPAFRTLAGQVAAELTTRRRGEVWTVATFHEDHAHPAADLAGPGHARIRMQYGFHATGKVTVQGMWPNGTTYGATSRNVDPARGVKAIASAADSYALRGCPPGSTASYLDQLPEVVTKWQAAQALAAQRTAIVARFAALVQADPPADGERTLNLSGYLPGKRGEVTVNFDDPPEISLELHGLTADTAAAILAVFARSDQAQARCCADYGDGHDPRLARLGCKAAPRTGPATYQESDALYSLYRQSGTGTPWAEWLGATHPHIHSAWR
jgi:hypothetical protein